MTKLEEHMPPTAPSSSDFTYADFYRTMIDRERLQVARDEATWVERHRDPERPVEVLLNFGCNVRQTPHLMREAVAVLEALDVDFAAVAGQQYCCGKPYSNNGLMQDARRVVDASVRRMQSYEPSRAIQWCSACEMQFKDLVIPKIGIPFQSDGLAAFLIERLAALGDQVPWRQRQGTRALVHGHFGEHVVRDQHPALAMQLLRVIPGVEVVGIAENPTLARCDNSGPSFANLDSTEYLAAQTELEGYVRDAGADTLVTLYHGCTRELGKFASERLSIRHYISVLAEALGVSKPDRFSELWRLGETDKVVEASRPNWESWGIGEDEARLLAHKYFVPSYALNAPDCACNGECTRTGARFLDAHPVDSSDHLIPVADLV
jgi:Fe-S oxidoreductase